MRSEFAFLIPCYNEEMTIERVIKEAQYSLPDAKIYVFDNNSSDRTAEVAQAAGALVYKEKRQGKGFVVQSMFTFIEADIYIMVDGDDTYDLQNVRAMVEMIKHGQADMVVGCRLETFSQKSFRPLHTFGNYLVAWLVNRCFGGALTDIMSGLRVMNRDFVKNINIMATGFEVETEMSIKALKYHFWVHEMAIYYRERPEGSFSKLNTYRDGIRVLQTIFIIFKDYKPLLFFSSFSIFFLFFSLACGVVVVSEFVETQYIRHVPLAILATGTMILSMILIITGVILDCNNRRFDELYNFVRKKTHI